MPWANAPSIWPRSTAVLIELPVSNSTSLRTACHSPAMVETSEAYLRIDSTSLDNGASTRRTACGSTTRRMAWARDMPSARAARSCAGATDSRPERKISVEEAPKFTDKPMMATAVADSWMPMEGRPSYRMVSVNSSGWEAMKIGSEKPWRGRSGCGTAGV